MGGAVDHTVFCTAATPRPERFGAWRESIGAILDVNARTTRAPDNFHARVESWMLDGVVISHCTTHAQAFARTAQRIVSDNVDHYMIQLFRKGGVEMRRGRGRVGAPPGALVGFDMAEVLDSKNSDFDLLNVFIPRRRLGPLLDSPDSLHGLVIDPTEGAGRLLADHIRALPAAGPCLTSFQAMAASDALISLTAAAFNGARLRPEAPPQWADAATALKARRHIAQNLADPDLTPARVAHAAGVSRACLYRATEAAGGVGAMIWDLRLKRCLADLVSVRHKDVQVGVIGYRWGFKSSAHFTRAFKRRYGVTPSEARALGVRALSSSGGPTPGKGRDYERWVTELA